MLSTWTFVWYKKKVQGVNRYTFWEVERKFGEPLKSSTFFDMGFELFSVVFMFKFVLHISFIEMSCLAHAGSILLFCSGHM